MDLPAAAAAADKAGAWGRNVLHVSMLVSTGSSHDKKAGAQATALLAEGWLSTVSLPLPLFLAILTVCTATSANGIAIVSSCFQAHKS